MSGVRGEGVRHADMKTEIGGVKMRAAKDNGAPSQPQIQRALARTATSFAAAAGRLQRQLLDR